MFKKIRRLICTHEYKTVAHPLLGLYLKCEKCGHVIPKGEYIAKLTKKEKRHGQNN